MFFFTFAVYLELFERVRSCFGVGYTLRCRIRVLNYNYAAATRCVSIDTQGVDRTDYELYINYLYYMLSWMTSAKMQSLSQFIHRSYYKYHNIPCDDYNHRYHYGKRTAATSATARLRQ